MQQWKEPTPAKMQQKKDLKVCLPFPTVQSILLVIIYIITATPVNTMFELHIHVKHSAMLRSFDVLLQKPTHVIRAYAMRIATIAIKRSKPREGNKTQSVTKQEKRQPSTRPKMTTTAWLPRRKASPPQPSRWYPIKWSARATPCGTTLTLKGKNKGHFQWPC